MFSDQMLLYPEASKLVFFVSEINLFVVCEDLMVLHIGLTFNIYELMPFDELDRPLKNYYIISNFKTLDGTKNTRQMS